VKPNEQEVELSLIAEMTGTKKKLLRKIKKHFWGKKWWENEKRVCKKVGDPQTDQKGDSEKSDTRFLLGCR